MKTTTFLFLSLLYTSLIFSQSANLDRKYFKGSYIEIPSNPVLDKAKRTFTVNSNVIKIKGFTRVDKDATIDLDFKFTGTKMDNTDIKSMKHEKKNKDGKIISTTYTYSIHTTYHSYGNLNIYNKLTGKSKNMPYERKSYYTSQNFNRYSEAQNYYNNNKYTIRESYKVNHRKEMMVEANYYLNNKYGYPIYNQRDNFWILGKKKHPEYANHNRAYKEAKMILAKMKYNEPIDDIKTEMEPIITYFKETVAKYPGKKKKMRKMRYASYYNLAKIYYYLDDADKMIEYAQKLIENDYDKKDGKRFIVLAKNLKQRLNANKVNTRHFDITPPEITSTLDTKKENAEDIIAYLITTEENDTIKATMPLENIKKIGYEVALKVEDETGKMSNINYSAIEIDKLALTNGDIYKTLDFDEVTKTNEDLSKLKFPKAKEKKFAKVIFESKIISIYLYKDKEIVIRISNNAKGVSTLSPDFALDFNKKLASYANNCPELLKEIQASHFKNTVASLKEFAEKLTACK